MNGLALQVELARGVAMREDYPVVTICRGETKGCERVGQLGGPSGRVSYVYCPDCYVVEANDPRSTGEILRDMERGDA